jgi:hypothetical protein
MSELAENTNMPPTLSQRTITEFPNIHLLASRVNRGNGSP